MSEIPSLSRVLVRVRDKFRCAWCAGHARQGEWHHRRSRSVVDGREHSPANGVWLHQKCHRYVHAHPFEARGRGFIVSRFCVDPATEPIDHKTYRGLVWLTDDGEVAFSSPTGSGEADAHAT